MITREKIEAIIISLCIVALGCGAVFYCGLPSPKNEEISNIEAISADVQYNLGTRYVAQEEYQEAVIAFEASIAINPRKTEAYVALADVYVVQEKPEEAVDVLEQALEVIEGVTSQPEEQEDITDGTDDATDRADKEELEQEKDQLLGKLDEVETEIKKDYGEDYEVIWTDPFVEQGMRNLLAKPEGIIMRSELDDISEIYVYGNSYFGTEPLEFDDYSAQNYQFDGVVYGAGTLSDLTDFTNCKGLKSLTVRWNAVHDLSPLVSLTRLRKLDLYSNQIGDISTFEKLPEEDLEGDLESSILEDLDTLLNLVNDGVTGFDLFLEVLNFKTVAIWTRETGGLSAVAESTWLPLSDEERKQFAAFGKLIDFGFFGGASAAVEVEEEEAPAVALVHLRKIDLSYNNITDLHALIELRKLKTLTLNHNGVADLTPLLQITTLQKLSLADNPIVDLSPLAQLEQLQWLNVKNNAGVSDWNPVAALETVVGRPENWAETSPVVSQEQSQEQEDMHIEMNGAEEESSIFDEVA